MVGLVPLYEKEETPESCVSPPVRRWASASQEGFSLGTKSTSTLILDFPASKTMRNIYPLFKPSSLQYFVVAAHAH